MNVVLVHGFNVKDPSKTIGKLVPVFADYGIHAHVFRYGWLGLAGVRWFSDNLAQAFRSHCQMLALDGPVEVVAHSHGALVTDRTAWLMHEEADQPPAFQRCTYLSPALDRDAPVSPTIKSCDVFHTRNDWAVRAGRLLAFHGWGDQGAVGFKGNDPRVHNFNCTAAIDSHSGWFKPAGLNLLRDRLVRPLAALYGRT